MDFAIEAQDLRKTYPGGVEAVRSIDFHVAAGEVFGLLGPNGAGKSTTVGMLTTTIAPTSGTAKLAGFDVAREPLEARRARSVVFQETGRGLVSRPRVLFLDEPTVGLDPRIRAGLLDALSGLRSRAELTVLLTTH